jgi:hypothetical protein
VLWLLFPWEGTLVLIEQEAGWAQSWSGHCGEEKNLSLPLVFEPWIGQLSHYTSYVSDSLMTSEGKCKLRWKLKNREQTYHIYWNIRQEFYPTSSPGKWGIIL